MVTKKKICVVIIIVLICVTGFIIAIQPRGEVIELGEPQVAKYTKEEMNEVIYQLFIDNGKDVLDVENINADAQKEVYSFGFINYSEEEAELVKENTQYFIDEYVKGDLVLREWEHTPDIGYYYYYGVINEIDGMRIFFYLRIYVRETLA